MADTSTTSHGPQGVKDKEVLVLLHPPAQLLRYSGRGDEPRFLLFHRGDDDVIDGVDCSSVVGCHGDIICGWWVETI